MRPRQTFHVLEALKDLPSTPLYRKVVRLSPRDSNTVLDVYQQMLALMIDLDYLHPDTLSRDVHRLWSDMIKVDVLDLNNAISECLQLVRLRTNKGFKALCSTISVHLYPLIKEDMNAMVRGDVLAAKRLMQLFSYTSRLSLKDIDLTQQMIDDYIATEDRLATISYDDAVTSSLNKIMRRWVGVFCPYPFHFKHGPGSVALLRQPSLQQKYQNMASDAMIRYCFPMFEEENLPYSRRKLDRTSQTIFVPKSYKTFRTISKEPASLMYLQQGVLGAIGQMVGSDSYLRDHIDTREQGRNRRLAQEGSISRNYATIDLSAASDSVSYELAKKVFTGTWLLRYIVCLRSPKTSLPNKEEKELLKFAPMGSALCFPVETLIFASVCELVTREHRVFGKYSVYGDDIIIPSQCVGLLISILESLGFLVNRSKSFFQRDCWFRESCGGEYCDGIDVTPMRVSRKYCSRYDEACFTGLVDMANTAYCKGFRHLRYCFIAKLRELGIEPVFSPTSLLSDSYTNYHLPERYNPHLQKMEVLGSATVSFADRCDQSKQNESIRYRHWLETNINRNRVDRFSKRLIPLEEGFKSMVCKTSMYNTLAWQENMGSTIDHRTQYLSRQNPPN